MKERENKNTKFVLGLFHKKRKFSQLFCFLMTSLENDKASLKFRLLSAQPLNYTFRLYISRWQTLCSWVILPFCLEQWKGSHQQWMSILIDKHGVHAPHFLIPFYSIKRSQSNLRHKPWLVLNTLVVNKRSSVSWIWIFKHVHFKLIECFYINSFSNIQWNLLIADILYSGHLSTADTFLGNGWNPGQTLTTKLLCSGHFIADTTLRSQLNFSPITDLLIADRPQY